MPYRSKRSQIGFFISEIVLALFVLGLMTSLLVTALYFQNRATRILAERRDALNRAERALVMMQNTPLDDSAGIHIRRLEQDSPVAGRAWVQVVVKYDHGQVSLVGLVPNRSLPREANP